MPSSQLCGAAIATRGVAVQCVTVHRPSGTYLDVIQTLAARLASRAPGHPLRVAVDGRTAAGKTTFGLHLAEAVRGHGRPALTANIDGFHNPKAVRYARGRMSPEGYYRDARDLAAVRRCLLEPLGPGGSRRIVRQTFDLAADQPVAPVRDVVPPDAVLITDGTFLQRPEFAGLWDIVVYLDVLEAVSLARGIARDAAALGGAEAAEAIYRARYLPGFAFYRSECDPVAGADAVVALSDFDAPQLRWQSSRG